MEEHSLIKTLNLSHKGNCDNCDMYQQGFECKTSWGHVCKHVKLGMTHCMRAQHDTCRARGSSTDNDAWMQWDSTEPSHKSHRSIVHGDNVRYQHGTAWLFTHVTKIIRVYWGMERDEQHMSKSHGSPRNLWDGFLSTTLCRYEDWLVHVGGGVTLNTFKGEASCRTWYATPPTC